MTSASIKMKWPADTRETQKNHARKHLEVLYKTMPLCRQFRTAVQAGGLVGLWPLYLSSSFKRVITFEPEPISRACLESNVRHVKNIEVRLEALGNRNALVGIERRSLGSHRITGGDNVIMIKLDDLELDDVDFIQLDVEGYEYPALIGANKTVERCRPVIQVEFLNETSQEAVTDYLAARGYRLELQIGRDYVFR